MTITRKNKSLISVGSITRSRRAVSLRALRLTHPTEGGRSSIYLVLGWMVALMLVTGCEPLYQSYSFTEPRTTSLPVAVTGDNVWVTSIPTGADVYVQPYEEEKLPTHATSSEAYQGKTPLQLTLPPGQYWIEVALDADVFSSYFSPPYDNVQFEQDGAASEALVFKPFAPGDKRRVIRYYRLEKQPEVGQSVIALFHPRGVPLERVAPLYPREEQFRFSPTDLPAALQAAELSPDTQAPLLMLIQRGGKAAWNRDEDYRVALEVQEGRLQGRIVELYTGPARPDRLLPDGGGF